MSTILKALRRVEGEHPAQPQRRSMRGDIVGGAGKPPPAPRPRKPRGPNLPLWGGLGAALLLAALVWWRLPSLAPEGDVVEAQPPETDVVEAQPPSGVAEPAAPATDPAAPPPSAPLAAAPEPAPPAPALAAVPDASAELPAELAERLPPLGETLDAPEAAPAPASPVAAASPAPPVAPPRAEPVARAEPRPPPVASPVAKPPAAKPPQLEAPVQKPAPVIAKKAPAPPPPSAPAVQVERTSWHPKPERRLAWVRLEGAAVARELHEGDALGTLVVKEIRPSAVVFLHGAETLERRVGGR